MWIGVADEGPWIDAKSIARVMAMKAPVMSMLHFAAEGSDADEAVSALDVSIQSQIVDLLISLQAEFGMSLIFISHDLSVVRRVAHRVMVLFLGRVVEIASRDAIYLDPRHPYTKALISAVPVPDPKIERAKPRRALPPELPSPRSPSSTRGRNGERSGSSRWLRRSSPWR